GLILQCRGRQLGADPPAVPGQHAAPSSRADQREKTEFQKTHPHDSRRDGNKMANDWEQARKENAAGFVAAQKNLRACELVRRHKKILRSEEHTSELQSQSNLV